MRTLLSISQFSIIGMLFGTLMIPTFSYCQNRDAYVDQLLLYVLGTGLIGLTSLKFHPIKVAYFGDLFARLVLGKICFDMIRYGWLIGHVADIDLLVLQDSKYKDITADGLQKLYYLKNTFLVNFQISLALISLLLLLSHKTKSLGYFTMASMTGLILLTQIGESCKNFSLTLTLVGSLGLLLPSLWTMTHAFIHNEPVRWPSHPLVPKNHFYHVSLFIKFILLIGLFVNTQNLQLPYKKYFASNEKSPIKGTWVIQDVQYEKNGEKDYQTDTLFQAKKIYLSSSRVGKIQVQDTVSTFEYMVDPLSKQLEFWNFNDYRKIDLKGKFEFLDDNKVLFNGKNEKDKISFIMVLEDKYSLKE